MPCLPDFISNFLLYICSVLISCMLCCVFVLLDAGLHLYMSVILSAVALWQIKLTVTVSV